MYGQSTLDKRGSDTAPKRPSQSKKIPLIKVYLIARAYFGAISIVQLNEKSCLKSLLLIESQLHSQYRYQHMEKCVGQMTSREMQSRLCLP